MLRSFTAHEFDANMTPTGNCWFFQAGTLEEAVINCLYTCRLTYGRAFVGPTGRTVYGNGKAYAIVEA